MAKRTNKSVSSVPVVESSVSEVLSDVLNEVSSETPSETPAEVVETVPVAVPNHLLPNFNRWLTSTLERKKNGGYSKNGSKIGRPKTNFTKPLRLVRHKNSEVFVLNGKGRPSIGDVLYTIVVPDSLVVDKETRFNVDLTTGDWSVVVPEEVRETLAA